MSQVPILSGIYADSAPDFRTSYPRNYLPVPKSTGLSEGYLKPADGIVAWGQTPPGFGRGGLIWNGVLYRVSGSKLISISSGGGITILGEVGGGGQVTMDFGFDRLAIWSGGGLYYWTGSTLLQVTDPDLGIVIDGKWIAGYYVSTDGTSIIVTDLNDPLSVNPLLYGSAESSPDKLLAIDELRDEMYALGRWTIQVFQNIGSTGTNSIDGNFPFQNIEGAEVPKGIIGTHAYCSIGSTFVFLGSGFGEAPAIYMMQPADTQKLSTREIDRILQDYTEAELAQTVCEVVVTKGHQWVFFHLQDRCLVYDTIGSTVAQEPIWYTLDSGLVTPSTYRARNFVWTYDRWCVDDPTSAVMGQTTDTLSSHYGQTIGWEFGASLAYAGGEDATVHEIELVGLPGRIPLGVDPTIWTSHSFDGETWSQERPLSAGKQGERMKRLAWRRDGRIRHYRAQKFRGTSDAHIPIARLEAQLELLLTRPGNGNGQ